MTAEPIDLVYTWVDDSTPGYLEQLRRYAGGAHDLNPNRTRDNLQLLRYSLRSAARFAPWVRRVVLFTSRPQVPDWLERGALEVVHHDQVMDAAVLPTFNSFAIISHLHLLPGLSRRFLYLEDDMLFGAPVAPEDFADARGRVRVFPRLTRTPAAHRRADARGSPWNASVANANHLLDARFGRARRRAVNHVPLLVDREVWGEMLAAWPEAAQATRRSRFRAPGNLAPEFLYPHYLLATGRGLAASLRETYRRSFYFPLENSLALAGLLIAAARALRPQFLTLNDNFGAQPHPGVVRRIARFLEDYFPGASRFERAPA
jgi:hypothetical protein